MWVQCGYILTLPKRKTHSEVPLSGLVVEIVGVEPTTPCLQSRCSSQLSYTPECGCKDATKFRILQIFLHDLYAFSYISLFIFLCQKTIYSLTFKFFLNLEKSVVFCYPFCSAERSCLDLSAVCSHSKICNCSILSLT